MKLTGWKLTTLFRSRKSRERNAYLRDSLDTSFQLSDRLADWSRSNDPRARLCVMRFHKEWRHPDCAVMKWYELQTCKQFKSIQHWRNLDTQFYHEFLIVLLADGSVCRVERMGEGSRADAIRRIGCTAYDLIKWFSAEDHAAKRWSRGSEELLIQVEFPNPFDLLDILAVCYTIQHKSPRTSVYTLQRYNCYFLCNTILVLLTRRVAEWEIMITDTDWLTLVDKLIIELKDKSLLPVKQQQAIEYIALGICCLLDPQSPNPAGFILEPLQRDLKNHGRERVNKSLANLLWYKYIDSAIDSEMSEFCDDVVETVLENPSPESAAFKLHALFQGVNEERFPPIGLDLPLLKKTMSKEVLTLCSLFAQKALAIAKWQLEMHELENKPSLSLRLVGSVAGLMLSAVPASLIARITLFFQKMSDEDEGEYGYDSDDEDFDEIQRIGGQIGVTLGQAIAATPTMTRLGLVKCFVMMDDEDEDEFEVDGFDAHAFRQDCINALFSNTAERLFAIMLTILQPESGLLNAPATLAFLNMYLPRMFWEPFLGCYVTGLRKDNFHSLFSLKATKLQTHRMDGMQAVHSISTVAEFQTHIQQRIQQHAERVQSFQLASAHLVHRDIERAMTEVWESLPTGFGACQVENHSEVNEI